MKPEDISDTLRISKRHHSLNDPFRNGEQNSLIDVVEDEGQAPPDNDLMSESLKNEISTALESLKEREKEVIRMYFGIEREYSLTF